MKAIINGKIVLRDRIVGDSAVIFDEKIKDIIPNEKAQTLEGMEQLIDAAGRYVAPGLIDIHIHGYDGIDVSDGSEEGVTKMAQGLLANGVTAFCPTTMTVAKTQIEKALSVIRALKLKSTLGYDVFTGAQILGANVEGPFINPEKKGAQAEEYILKPDAAFVKQYADVIKLITIAPEMDENFACIRELARDTGILLSMGHTGASYDVAIAAVKAGISHTTHLFNAMTPLMHRNPGVVGAALSTDVSAELICDTFHINPGLYSMVEKLKGDKLILITDCISAGGLSDGVYSLGGQKTIVKGIECRLEDGTIAGSVLKLNNAVKNFRQYTGLPLFKAVCAASINPATAIGVADKKGSIEKEKDADMIIVDEDMSVSKTLVRGSVYFEN
ncbi:MAG: N-acetylglucosamine-6-phosphate deacetylase [Oscillospiraceae bacterium]|nr:N-acetylglucosamine-6-phosphate deacetylase [Oscillospiraceae bacterium]